MSHRTPLLKVLGACALLLSTAACGPSPEPPAPQPTVPDEGTPPPDTGSPPDAGTPPPTQAPPPLPERASCSGLTVSTGTYEWEVLHLGYTRRYRVHVPPGYDATRPTAAVLNFHGYSSNALEQEYVSRMSEVADAEGFLAVYPQGLDGPELGLGGSDTRSWNAGDCCGQAQLLQADDVGFVDALLADLDTRVCLDTKRLYATGLSNGGFFSYRLACERSGQFAAIAPVAGMESLGACAPGRPVPVMHFHGTDDTTVLYEGGNNVPFSPPYPSAAESVSRWALRNQCNGSADTTYVQGDSTCVTHTTCTLGASCTLCTVQGGGHTWPGGLVPPEYGKTTQDLDATREMWLFFSAHPRP